MYWRDRPIRQFDFHHNWSHRWFLANVVAAVFTTLHGLHSSGKNKFMWVMLPMGLLGAPSSFQRLMETVVQGIKIFIVYVDNLLVHSAMHQTHIKLLNELLAWLVMHNVKINLQKCFFQKSKRCVPRFSVNQGGSQNGEQQVESYFLSHSARFHAQNLSISQALQFLLQVCAKFRTTHRTSHDANKKRMPLEKSCIPTYLCSEPVVAYPRQDQLYALITNASLGIDQQPGGLGAVLMQIDEQGKHCVIDLQATSCQNMKLIIPRFF